MWSKPQDYCQLIDYLIVDEVDGGAINHVERQGEGFATMTTTSGPEGRWLRRAR